MYHCSNCGKEVPENEKFCGFCGTRVTAEKENKPEENVSTVKEESKTNGILTKLKDKEYLKSELKDKKVIIGIVAAVVALVLAGIIIFTLLAGSIGAIFAFSKKASPAKDFEFEMTDGTVTITKYIGSDLKVVIPKKINGRPVTVIGEEAFAEYDLTHVTIPDTVTLIDFNAFGDCVCLKSVKFSKSLTSIDYCAFDGCTSLKEISLPDSLEIIDEKAFSDCTSLKKISFPKNLKRIESSAFRGCAVKKVTLPNNLEYLGSNAFAECPNLKSLQLPNNAKIDISSNKPEYYSYYSISGYTSGSFSSPVGGYTYEKGESLPDLFTTLVVKKGSRAYDQVINYSDYVNIIVKYW
ncbi:MAG: leucine-rich repeat protein [Clostridia bacterium]|nr:leucine-rich repeat protein [Clostridia bacterium]